MKQNTKWIAALTIVFAALVTVNLLHAQEPTAADESVIVDAEPAQVVEPVQVVEPAQVVGAPCNDCCAPKYCISYRKLHQRRKVCCGCCEGPYTAILNITDPCNCCPVEVPVCVPGCCTDVPKMSCRRGLFGRMIYEYTWCCGFRARIVLSTRRSTISVTTYGS